ncbi:FluC/FEX family fluoride channel [Alicyclobacillus fastidiosus]|uniref:Fluoride-specific ion channel n=1 Tax=Alicyclobacillus fastidiosus TaxID=392011 RepID=A0ABV5AB75_9BACL|nr:CrcB family protein [Alicyclobacillus fastidiosus]WEH10799.1 CrcB family protein [Alicyclobacillus fastidiosus]
MNIISVLAFGFLGGISRYACGTSLMSILVVNALGAVALGLLSVLRAHLHMKIWLEVGVSSGLIGSFTTFSGLVWKVVPVTPNHAPQAFVGLAVSIGSIALCAVAIRVAHVYCRTSKLTKQADENQHHTRNHANVMSQFGTVSADTVGGSQQEP